MTATGCKSRLCLIRLSRIIVRSFPITNEILLTATVVSHQLHHRFHRVIFPAWLLARPPWAQPIAVVRARQWRAPPTQRLLRARSQHRKTRWERPCRRRHSSSADQVPGAHPPIWQLLYSPPATQRSKRKGPELRHRRHSPRTGQPLGDRLQAGPLVLVPPTPRRQTKASELSWPSLRCRTCHTVDNGKHQHSA